MQTDPFAVDRARLIDQIATDTRETAAWTGRHALATAVIEAMRAVPRHRFVDKIDQDAAYENRPLAIGHGQTISQPFIVALMTDLLDAGPSDRILEIGTGSGYQAAILARLVAEVWTIERHRALADRARSLFTALGLDNVHTRCGDGAQGWPEQAPFDGILVTAAAPRMPEPLVAQLAPGGRLVIPIGGHGDTQTLYRCEKRGDGTLDKVAKLSVAFVPLVSDL